MTRADFDGYWIEHSSAVVVARFGGYLIGAYHLKPNFVGRAAHIANAGYFVSAPYRSTGVGRTLVEHSLRQARRSRLRRHDVQPRLRFQRGADHVRKARLREIRRIPHAVEGEDALIYWRGLEDIEGVQDVGT